MRREPVGIPQLERGRWLVDERKPSVGDKFNDIPSYAESKYQGTIHDTVLYRYFNLKLRGEKSKRDPECECEANEIASGFW